VVTLQKKTPNEVAQQDELTQRINEKYREVEEMHRSTVEGAIELGGMLIEKKESLAHGEWLPWVKQYFEGSDRHARRFMELYRDRDKLLAGNRTRVSDLCVRGALQELGETHNKSKVRRPWTPEEKDLRDRLKAGETIVVNKYKHEKLIEWAKARNLYVSITRPSRWGNPNKLYIDEASPLTKHEERERAVKAYEQEHLPQHPELLKQIPSLKGKVLVCVCAPKLCHGHVLAALADGRESPTKAAFGEASAPPSDPKVIEVERDAVPSDVADTYYPSTRHEEPKGVIEEAAMTPEGTRTLAENDRSFEEGRARDRVFDRMRDLRWMLEKVPPEEAAREVAARCAGQGVENAAMGDIGW
jgi:hypothetical protein